MIAAAILLTAVGTVGIIKYGSWLRGKDLRILTANPAVNYQLHYQPGALLIAIAISVVATAIGHFNFLKPGDFSAAAAGFEWLGILDGTSWKVVGTTFTLVPALGTAVVAGFQVLRDLRPSLRVLANGLVWALPFSVTNALAEELIFRSTYAQLVGTGITAMTVALVSGASFGIPHYLGTPGKTIGVAMAGWLGWVMMLATLQTGGLGWAWSIHWAQDVPIFTFMIAASKARPSQ